MVNQAWFTISKVFAAAVALATTAMAVAQNELPEALVGGIKGTVGGQANGTQGVLPSQQEMRGFIYGIRDGGNVLVTRQDPTGKFAPFLEKSYQLDDLLGRAGTNSGEVFGDDYYRIREIAEFFNDHRGQQKANPLPALKGINLLGIEKAPTPEALQERVKLQILMTALNGRDLNAMTSNENTFSEILKNGSVEIKKGNQKTRMTFTKLMEELDNVFGAATILPPSPFNPTTIVTLSSKSFGYNSPAQLISALEDKFGSLVEDSMKKAIQKNNKDFPNIYGVGNLSMLASQRRTTTAPVAAP